MMWPRHHHNCYSSGFTLIELLVTTVIVGILVSLLLPVVRAARETARRATCMNNMRQVSIALLNHEQAQKGFPPGAQAGPYASFGVSWWVDILPYLGESAVHSSFDTSSRHSGLVGFHPKNGRLVDGLTMPSLACPSSPFSKKVQVGSFQLMAPSYVGVAGAANGQGFSEPRVNPCCGQVDGEISGGGLLPPNRSVKLKEITDGTSRTAIVGETSDYVFYESVAFRIDAGFPSGWVIGTRISGTPPRYAAPYAARNITTVRYRANERRYRLPGIWQELGPNNPFTSAHPGGVNASFADGSARFVADSVEIRVLKSLATRDDGSSSANVEALRL